MTKFNKIINLVTIFLLLALPYYLFEGKLYVGGDDTRLLYSYPFEYLKNFVFFTWTNNSTIGVDQPNQFLVPFLSLWSLLDHILNNKVILSYFAFSLPLVSGFIYFKKFVRELFNLDSNYDIELYIGSLCFILSPIIIFDQLYIFLTTVWLLGVIPAIGYYYIRYIKNPRFEYIYVSMVICLFFSLALFSIPWILGFLLPLSAGAVVLLVLSKKKEIITVIKRSIFFSGFIILSQSFWLLGFLIPHFIHDKNSFASRISSQGFLDTFSPTVLATAKGYIIYPLLNLFHRQIAFDFVWKLKDEFVNLYDKTLFLDLIFPSVLLLGFISYKRFLNKENRKIYLFILTSLLVSLFLFTVNIGPLKNVFLSFGNIPGFVMFRNFYDKFAPGYIIIYSILVTISLVLIKKNYKHKYVWVNLAIFAVIILNFSAVKHTVNSPLWTTDNVYKTITIPQEYISFTKDIDKKISPTNSILSIPFTASLYSVIKDENSNRVYVGTSPLKLFSGVNDISGDMSFNFTSNTDIATQMILKRQYPKLNKFLYDHNINYVLVTKNIPTPVLSSYIFYPTAERNQDDQFLKAVSQGKKILTSSKGNYVIYAAKKRNTLLSSKNLIFKKISPVKYSLSIKKINGQQSLEFNDSFNPGWKLYLKSNSRSSFCGDIVYKNGNVTECRGDFVFFNLYDFAYSWMKPIFDSSHTQINKFSNKWIIDSEYIKKNWNKNYYTTNKDGSINIELVLYFRPQNYFYYGVIISTIVFLSATCYMIYLLKKNYE
ncbi:MAG TPA: hypothetical protein VG917_00030 [Patescibacteria group bacterium]|nr:hypothetical protein [Patescibacteria group bacterium]